MPHKLFIRYVFFRLCIEQIILLIQFKIVSILQFDGITVLSGPTLVILCVLQLTPNLITLTTRQRSLSNYC